METTRYNNFEEDAMLVTAKNEEGRKWTMVTRLIRKTYEGSTPLHWALTPATNMNNDNKRQLLGLANSEPDMVTDNVPESSRNIYVETREIPP